MYIVMLPPNSYRLNRVDDDNKKGLFWLFLQLMWSLNHFVFCYDKFTFYHETAHTHTITYSHRTISSVLLIRIYRVLSTSIPITLKERNISSILLQSYITLKSTISTIISIIVLNYVHLSSINFKLYFNNFHKVNKKFSCN